MRFLLPILFPFLLKGQIPSDVKHVYAGVGISVATGVITYNLTEGRWLESMGVGLATGVVAGLAKEYIWDKEMKRGTFNKMDILSTNWGALIGTVSLCVVFDTKEKKKRKKFKYYESLQSDI